MMTIQRRNLTRHRRRRGFTIVEAAMSIVLVGVMLVAALNAAGASRLAMLKLSDRGQGMLLAQEIMTEILAQEYEDPAIGSGSFGRTGAKDAAIGRSLYDDVDDFYNWSASPPEDRNGTVKADLAGWTRTVLVEWANAGDMRISSVSDTRIKRITVTVSKKGVTVATLVAFRAAGGDLLVAAKIAVK